MTSRPTLTETAKGLVTGTVATATTAATALETAATAATGTTTTTTTSAAVSWFGRTLKYVGISLPVIIVAFGIYLNYRYPDFCSPRGSYQQLGIIYDRVVVPSQGCRLKIIYPAIKKNTKEFNHIQQAPYLLDGSLATEGIARYANISKHLLLPLISGSNNLPLWLEAPLLKPKNNNKYPVIIFSHGVGGSFDSNMAICYQLASFGFIVVIADHTDGSAGFTIKYSPENSTYENFFYVRGHLMRKNEHEELKPYYPKPNEWTREMSMEFRQPQLKYRVQELTKILQYIQNSNSNSNSNPKIAALNEVIDWDNLFLAGHSFGGMTAVLTAREWTNTKLQKVSGVLVYDGWFEPIPDEILSEKWNTPCICLSSDLYAKSNSKRSCIQKALTSNAHDHKYFLQVVGTTHTDYADVPLWAPVWLQRLVASADDTDEVTYSPHQYHDLIVDLSLAFIEEQQSSQDSNKALMNSSSYKHAALRNLLS